MGPSVLVAPILEQGKVSRKVILPPSVTFYDFFTGEAIKAVDAETIEVQAPLNKVPVFVKEGSIVPLYSKESVAQSSNMAAIRKKPF